MLSTAELDPVEVEVEVVEASAAPVEVDEAPDVEPVDSAGVVVSADPTPLEKPVEPVLPPQAATLASQGKRARDGRMRVTLARARAPVI